MSSDVAIHLPTQSLGVTHFGNCLALCWYGVQGKDWNGQMKWGNNQFYGKTLILVISSLDLSTLICCCAFPLLVLNTAVLIIGRVLDRQTLQSCGWNFRFTAWSEILPASIMIPVSSAREGIPAMAALVLVKLHGRHFLCSEHGRKTFPRQL